MKKIFSLLTLIFISFSSYGQVRKIGNANDSIYFSSIVTGPDSSIYFIASKGNQHLFILKTNRQLDTAWSKTISVIDSYDFPNAVYFDDSQELLINCSTSQLVKLDSSGTLIFKKQINLPSASNFKVRSALKKSDSLLFAVYRYDSIGYHNGIAIADTAGNITTFHDYGARPMEKIMEYNGGYYVSPAGIMLDANFNIIDEYYINGSSQFFSYWMGESSVLNDTVIVGSKVVYNNFGPEADEILKITQNGLQWVVKDDLIVGNPAYQITPVKLFPNGNIVCVMSSVNNFFIGIVDSNGYPVSSSALNVFPDTYNYKIGVCDLGNSIAYAFGNVIGIADTSGATCLSTFGTMDQYGIPSSFGGLGSSPDSMYSLNWNVTTLIDTASQASMTVDAICTPVGVEDLSDETNIVIYPNPWKDHFQISRVTPSMSQLTITDISGKIVFENAVKNSEQIIVPEFISSGFYLVKIDSASKPIPTIKVD